MIMQYNNWILEWGTGNDTPANCLFYFGVNTPWFGKRFYWWND